MNLKDNSILLTGASSGIGYALLKRFHEAGNNILVTSRDEESLTRLKKEFPGIETAICNLASDASVKKLLHQCQTTFQSLNMIVNNAGVQFNYQWLEETDIDQRVETEIRTNFTSPLKIIHGLLPLLQEQPNAAIVNVSSGLAFAPKQSAPVYCATKAALHNFSKALRYQLEATNIKVFEIIPPIVETPMTEGRGTGKITPEQLVDEFVTAFEKDKFEINIGKTRLLRLISRLAPGVADGILKNS